MQINTSTKSICIIGQGFVGQATALTLNHAVKWHDPPKGLTADYSSADVVFVCCFDDVLDHYLAQLKHHACVIVRSTLIPDKLHNTSFAVYPEFLVERTWETDALNPIQIVFGGSETQFHTLKSISKLDMSTAVLTDNKTAALMKVTVNAFLATKLIFLNQLYQVCESQGLDYNQFRDVLKIDARLGTTHFDVPGPDGQFGFGGKCFPKDVQLLQQVLQHHSVDTDLMAAVLNTNQRFRH